MRGEDTKQGSMFSYISLESRIPSDHPLREMRRLTDRALFHLSPRFDELYSTTGRRSIAPERLLRALLLQALYTIRSERQLIEQLDYNLLFRWFVGLEIDDPVWDVTVFTKNRDRLVNGDIARAFFEQTVGLAGEADLLSSDHFTVDGTLIEASASHKSFRPKDGDDDDDGGENFHGKRRRNETHESTTDPDARLYRKGGGKEAKLCYMGHVMMENRNGLIVNADLSVAGGRAEVEAGVRFASEVPGVRRATLGADKGYDTNGFVEELRSVGITPHVAQNDRGRRSAIDERTTRHPGYQISQVCRKLVETTFGWMKHYGGLRKLRHRGKERVGWTFLFTAGVFNLVRLRTLKCPT